MIGLAFAPEVSPRAFRATELALELCKQGHSVEVLTYSKNQFSETIPGLTLLKRLHRKKVQRRPLLDRLKWYRIAEHFFEYPDIGLMGEVSRELKQLTTVQYDGIISIAVPYPIHWGTAFGLSKNKSFSKTTWIADCGDPYMGAQLLRLQRPFYFAYLEHYFCKRASYLTVPTEGSQEGYYARYRSKIKVIPQGFAMNFTPPEYVPRKVPTFAYAGALSAVGPRNIFPFIRALQECRTDFRFHVYSSSADSLLSGLDDPRVVLHPPLPRESLLPELAKMDFLVNFDNGTSRQTPSKLIDYTIAGRPIYNVWIEQIAPEILQSFLQRDYSFAYQLPNPGQYDIRNVAAGFLSLLNEPAL